MKPPIRIVIIILVSFILALILPVGSFENRVDLGSPVPLVVIYSLVITFFISAAREKNGRLKSNIAAELSRARRVYHLINELNSAEPNWKNNVKNAVANYLLEIGRMDFNNYDKTISLFRLITQPIYSFKEIKTLHDESIYRDLLNTLSHWAILRQSISSDIKHRLSRMAWLTIIISAILPSMALIFTRTNPLSSKLIAGGALAMIFLVLNLLHEVENLSSVERQEISKQYSENAKLCQQ